MSNKDDSFYMKMVDLVGQQSYCKRRKVGSVIVRNRTIIAEGYNGTVSGLSNDCEDESGVTHDYTIHAEMNAILKCAKNGVSVDGGTLYCNTSPCANCAKSIAQSGIKRVVYSNPYRDLSPVKFLQLCGILVDRFDDSFNK